MSEHNPDFPDVDPVTGDEAETIQDLPIYSNGDDHTEDDDEDCEEDVQG